MSFNKNHIYINWTKEREGEIWRKEIFTSNNDDDEKIILKWIDIYIFVTIIMTNHIYNNEKLK